LNIDDVLKLIRDKGFKDTLHVLSKFEGYKCEMRTFYKELNMFSYYNSFFRVKDELLQKRIIKIERRDKKKTIGLTTKGIEIYNKLLELNDVLNENN